MSPGQSLPEWEKEKGHTKDDRVTRIIKAWALHRNRPLRFPVHDGETARGIKADATDQVRGQSRVCHDAIRAVADGFPDVIAGLLVDVWTRAEELCRFARN